MPTLGGNLSVPRDGSANTPLLAMGLDPADPFSTAMWVAPASLDALLLRAPEGAHFLFFSHSSEHCVAFCTVSASGGFMSVNSKCRHP